MICDILCDIAPIVKPAAGGYQYQYNQIQNFTQEYLRKTYISFLINVSVPGI